MFNEYSTIVRISGMKIEPRVLLIAGGIVIAFALFASLATKDAVFFLVGLILADILVFFPYYKGMSKIQELEENLPDALRQIATILRSGGTYEVAIREVVASDYGFLSKQFSYVLEDLESGLTFQDALLRLSDRVPSELLARTVVIISDAVRAGGGLANVLEDVSEDARETWRLLKERKAKTTMQVLFIFAASGILAPFIVGIAKGIMGFFVELGKRFVESGVVKPEELAKSAKALDSIALFLTIYVLMQAALSSIMMALIREGRIHTGIVILPFLMFLAYVVMIGGSFLVKLILHV